MLRGVYPEERRAQHDNRNGTMLLEKLSNARGVSGDEREVREILINAIKTHVT